MQKNKSGREMVKYPETKSDPLCKWRVVSVSTVVELVGYLPKKEMSKNEFRKHMAASYKGDFFHTPYQLAAQLGLYYEDEVKFIPRFDHDINQEEALEYIKKWMQRYYVPNPFTKRGFIGIKSPYLLLDSLVDYLNTYPTKPNLAIAGAALFGGKMGNLACVKRVLNDFSDIIKVDEDYAMSLVSEKVVLEKTVDYDRNDKNAFFHHFD